MWEPRRLTTLRAFMACYRDSFTFYLLPWVRVKRKEKCGKEQRGSSLSCIMEGREGAIRTVTKDLLCTPYTPYFRYWTRNSTANCDENNGQVQKHGRKLRKNQTKESCSTGLSNICRRAACSLFTFLQATLASFFLETTFCPRVKIYYKNPTLNSLALIC
jgi:hypothetical protein